jgi:hypothetical protein
MLAPRPVAVLTAYAEHESTHFLSDDVSSGGMAFNTTRQHFAPDHSTEMLDILWRFLLALAWCELQTWAMLAGVDGYAVLDRRSLADSAGNRRQEGNRISSGSERVGKGKWVVIELVRECD